MKKKIISVILVVFVLSVIGVVIWVKFVSVNDVDFITDSDSPIASLACIYPVKVVGDSMDPYLKNGDTSNFSKCFDGEDLSVGTVITYKDGSVQRIGIIREVKMDEVFDVSNESRSDEIKNVNMDDIVAISDIETSE